MIWIQQKQMFLVAPEGNYSTINRLIVHVAGDRITFVQLVERPVGYDCL